jgi:hypothetical protein
VIALQEPDFHPAPAVESAVWREAWEGFVAWAERKGIDFTGRKLPRSLQKFGFEQLVAAGETLLFNGGSLAPQY